MTVHFPSPPIGKMASAAILGTGQVRVDNCAADSVQYQVFGSLSHLLWYVFELRSLDPTAELAV